MQLWDLANVSPRSTADREFTYANININSLSDHLGIKWETSKSSPFGEKVAYLGFQWNLRSQVIYLPDKKKARYLAVITEWREKPTHDLRKTQRLYRKLLHAMLVIPAGQAYLTNLEAMLASFNSSPFRPHTPPRSTPDNLNWWQHQLRQAIILIPVCRLQPLTDYKAYSDASSSFSVVITIGPRWQAWQLVAGWKSQGRDIQWAEAVRFELLTLCVCSFSSKGEHIVLYGNNQGVVKGWWKCCSTNKLTNHVFQHVLQLSEDCRRKIHMRYVLSAKNPTDGPSWGHYPPPAPSCSTPLPSPTRYNHFSLMSNLGELAKKVTIGHLVHTQELDNLGAKQQTVK